MEFVSTSHVELTKAMFKAQAMFKDALKTSENKHLKSKYATLLDVLEAVRGPLQTCGLLLSQSMHSGPEGASGVVVRSTLIHAATGQAGYVQVYIPCAPTAQGVAAACTYGRRITLSALCGITADEDDDGEGAMAPVLVTGRPPSPPPRKELVPAPVRTAYPSPNAA